jgi:hypothetical protein
VSGHVEQTHAVARAVCVRLPADAADPQADDFRAAQAAEQPRDGQGAHQFYRVAVSGVAARRKIRLVEVEPGPEELRPQIIGDHPRGRADQGLDRPRGGQGPRRIKAPGHPAPLVAVPEKLAHRPGVALLRSRRQRVTESITQGTTALGEVPDVHAIDRRHVPGAQLAGPGGRLRDCRMRDLEPAPGFEDA